MSEYGRRLPETQTIEKITVFNEAGVGAGASILTTALTPSDPPTLFRIMVSFSKECRFTLQLTQGVVTKDLDFNGGVNLVAAALYTFDILVEENDSINFEQDQAAQTVNVLIVQEIRLAAQ